MSRGELAHLQGAIRWAIEHEADEGDGGDAARLIRAAIEKSPEMRRLLWGRSTRHTRPPKWDMDRVTSNTAPAAVAALYTLRRVRFTDAVTQMQAAMADLYGQKPNRRVAEKFLLRMASRWDFGGLVGHRKAPSKPSADTVSIEAAMRSWIAPVGADTHGEDGDSDEFPDPTE
jgi:hypothetical protein